MGILALLLLPLSGPVWCLRLVLDRLREEAEATLHDEQRGFGELIELSMRHRTGKLSDEEFAEQEAKLLDRLNSMREYRNELANAEAELQEHAWAEDEEKAWVEGEEQAPVESDEEAVATC